MCQRSGLSRVEALLILLIAAVLAGLALSAIGRVRHAAALAGCRNNLRQLGIAVHNYHATWERLPPLVDQGDGALTGKGLPSLFANLMPSIEGTDLVFRPEQSPDYYHAHSSVVFTYPHKGEPITRVGGMANNPYRPFLDPGDATAHQLRDIPMTLPDGSTGYYATGSYAANGLLPWGTGSLLQSFPHGTQNTVLLGERPQVCRTASGGEVYNLWGLGIYSPHMPAFAALTPADPPGLRSTGQVAPVVPLPAEGAAGRLRVRIDRRDAAPGPPDFPTPVQRIGAGRPCDPRLPGGPHAAGLQVVMADGSVRVFAWDTSPWAFWAACTPDQPADER